MRTLGIWLIAFAVGSYLLPMIGMQFFVVAWIFMWGPTVAWAIRIAMLVLGVALLVGGSFRAGARRTPT